MLKISLIIIGLFISACTTTSNKPKIKLPQDKIYKVHNIELRPHQILPIEYMLQHPEQKGLLLAHYLGTGKTFTALAYAEKKPGQKVIILSPSFIKANWLLHMNKMGITNKERYEFLSFDEAAKTLPKRDISSSIVIVDEVHRLIEGVKSRDTEIRKIYSVLYNNLKDADKIFLLSGTPVFNELSDTAFVFNLAAGQDLLPCNEREFLDDFTKVKKGASFWRGHFTESNILIFGLPFVLAGIPLAFVMPTIPLIAGLYFGGLAAGFTIFPIINASVPIETTPMRYFSADKLKDLSETYVSYYDFRYDKDPDYPTQKVYEKPVEYNNSQRNFFINFADMSLSNEELALIAREKAYGIKNTAANLDIESTSIQKKLKDWPDSGREIGNLSFRDEKNTLIEAPKFLNALELMNKVPDGIVVYSSYYENGSKLFADFLDRHGKKDSYKFLDPALSTDRQMAIIDGYNAKEFPILLLHPVFTEGISLEGTRQIHILEPIPSHALFEQIIGRTVRYNSHAKLPKNERHVDVYLHKSTFSGVPAMLARNKGWGKRFNELNSAASFGSGLAHIDPNYERKQLSFDQFTDLKRVALKDAMQALNELFKKYSIE